MKTVDVHVECEVVTVRLQLGPRSRSSVLETLVLKAIQAGVNTTHELSDLFCLTPRLILDLLGDLWRLNRVVFEFDPNGEKIKLTPEALTELDALGPDQVVNSAMVVPSTEDVLLDTLTGRVVPVREGRNRPARANFVVTRMADDRGTDSIESKSLAAALNRALDQRDTADPEGEMRVLEAYLAPKDLSSGGTRYLTMSMQVGADAGRLVVLVDDPRLQPADQTVATERLQGLIAAQPQSAFVQALRGAAGHVVETPRDIGRDLERLAQATRGLAKLAPANRRREHDAIAARAALLDGRVGDLAKRQMSVTMVRTTEEHRAAIIGLLESAQTQVVMALPWIHYRNGLDQYVRALKDAVARDVVITVLWGIGRAAEAPEDLVIKAFEDVMRSAQTSEGRGALRFDKSQAAHLHAKVVIADDRRALVTSKNFASRSNHAELGLVVTADDRTAAPVIEELLEWSRQTAANYDQARALITDRTVFGDRTAEVTHVSPWPPEFEGWLDEAPSDSAPAVLWSRAWTAFGDALGDTVAAMRPVIHLVRDQLHTAYLWSAFGTARKRVLISSDSFSSNVVNADFIAKVRACLDRGVDVALVYRKAHDPAEDKESIAALRELTEAGNSRPGSLTLREDSTNHTKVLVVDDEVVVGSYNYLSFEGRYGAGRRRLRSEISLRVQSAEVTAKVVRSVLGEHADRWSPQAATAVRASTRPQSDLGLVNVGAQQAISLLSATGMAFAPGRLAALCSATPGTASVVDALIDAGMSDHLLRRVYAALFWTSELGSADYERWGGELFDSLWAAHSFGHANMVRRVLPTDRSGPSEPHAAVAAVFGGPEAAGLLTAAYLAGPDTEYPALAVLASVGLLLTGDDGWVDPFEALRTEAVAVAEFTSLAHRHFTTFGRLPVEALSSSSDARRHAHEDGTAWQRIGAAVTAFEQYNPDCLQGNLTRDYLVGTGGPLTTLREIVEQQNLIGLAVWVQQNGTDEGKWLDRATRASGSRSLITQSRRRSMTAKGSVVLKAAKGGVATIRGTASGTAALLPTEQLTTLGQLGVSAGKLRADRRDDLGFQAAVWALSKVLDAIEGGSDE